MAFSPSNKKKNHDRRELREVSHTMTEKRREKLLLIQKREQMKDVLVTKFQERYAERRKAGEDTSEGVIAKEVGEFMDTAAVTENNLKRLEKRIAKGTAGPGDENEMVSVSAYSGRTGQTGKSQTALTSQSGVHEKTTADAILEDQMKRQTKKDWKILDEYAVYLHEQDAKSAKSRKYEGQARLHRELDEQVAEYKDRMAHAGDDDIIFHKNSMQELEEWKVTEEEKIVDQKQKNIAEKVMRDEQLALQKASLKEEAERKLVEEKLAVSKIIKEIEADEKKAEQKKRATILGMQKVFKENEENKARKEAEKEAARKREVAEIKAYNRVLDQQEKARQKEKEERVERQKLLMDRMKATVQAQAESKGQEDEERALAQKEEADKRALELDIMKKAKLEALRHKNRDYLLSQMQDKADKKVQALELKTLQAGILDADTKEYEKAEKEKVEQKKYRYYQHKLELQQQIQDKQAQEKNIEMSSAEASLNKDLLELVSKALTERDAGN